MLPENSACQQVELLNSLKKIKADLEQVARTMDLSSTCLAFQIPVLGALTRFEAICFFLYHAQRHDRQLNNVLKKVTSDK